MMISRRLRMVAATSAVIPALLVAGCASDTVDTTAASSTSASPDKASEAPVGPSESEQLSDAFAASYSTTSWYPAVSSVRVDKRNAYVTVQGDKTVAETIQRAMINLIETGDIDGQFRDVRWVIVEDSSGTVITQQQVKR